MKLVGNYDHYATVFFLHLRRHVNDICWTMPRPTASLCLWLTVLHGTWSKKSGSCQRCRAMHCYPLTCSFTFLPIHVNDSREISRHFLRIALLPLRNRAWRGFVSITEGNMYMGIPLSATVPYCVQFLLALVLQTPLHYTRLASFAPTSTSVRWVHAFSWVKLSCHFLYFIF